MNTVYDVKLSRSSENDLNNIFDHFMESYISFGDDFETAYIRAEARIKSIRADLTILKRFPHRGTLHDDMKKGLRHLSIGQCVIWFQILDTDNCVRILGLFLSAQDHFSKILERLINL